MKNSFIVQFAVRLLVMKLGIGSLGAFFLVPIAAWLLGEMLDRGIVKLDLTFDSIKEALKDSEFRDAAKKAYDKASAKVYTEEEKVEIRKQYIEILRKYAVFG